MMILFADLVLFCNEKDFMFSLLDNNQVIILQHLTLHQDI